jgi:hypothetical protein
MPLHAIDGAEWGQPDRSCSSAVFDRKQNSGAPRANEKRQEAGLPGATLGVTSKSKSRPKEQRSGTVSRAFAE